MPGVLGRELGDQPHDVVVVDDGGGEEDELEVELVDVGWSPARRRLPLPCWLLEALGGFQIDAAEAAQVVLRAGSARWRLALLVGEVGVLVELGLEALDFLEVLDEGGAGVVALEVGHGLRARSRGPGTS